MDDLLARAVDDVVVGRHLAADDRFAQAPARLHDHVVLARVRVAGEQDPAHGRVDHLLDEDGEAYGAVVESLALTIDQDSWGEQRAPALADREQDLLDAGDVEVRLLEAGERRAFEVLGRGTRSDGGERDGMTADELLVRRYRLSP